MHRAICRPIALLICLLLIGCAGDTYAPVVDRTSSGGASGSYEVSRGDTLYSIAFRHGLDYRDLAAWNSISAPYVIHPGQSLRLSPASGTAQRRQTASSPSRTATAPSSSTSRSTTTGSRAPTSGSTASTERVPSRGSWQWPVQGPVLKEFSAEGDGKQGINIGGESGQEVRAAASGRVVYSGSGLVGYGNLIILKHEDDYLTAYGYNSELLVEEGADVSGGQTIARMGRNANRPMLHFELRREGRPVDPLGYLPRRR